MDNNRLGGSKIEIFGTDKPSFSFLRINNDLLTASIANQRLKKRWGNERSSSNLIVFASQASSLMVDFLFYI